MSVTGVHRLSLSLPPCSLPTIGKRTQSLLSHHFSLVHHSHRLVTSFRHNAYDKTGAEAEPSYDEGEMLDKNGTSRKNPFVSQECFLPLLYVAFGAMVGICLGLALMLFIVVTLLSA